MILDICTYLREYFTPIAKEMQHIFKMCGPSELPKLKFKKYGTFISEYIEGANTVFSDGTPGLDNLRNTFLMFLSDTSYCVLRDQAFIEALQDCQILSHAIMKHIFTEGSTFLNLLPNHSRMVPLRCNECESHEKQITATWLTAGSVDGRCRDCQDTYLLKEGLWLLQSC